VDEGDILDIEDRLRAINPGVEIMRTTHSQAEPEKLIGIKAFDLERVTEKAPDFLTAPPTRHDSSVTSVAFQFEGFINMHKLHTLFLDLLENKAEDLYETRRSSRFPLLLTPPPLAATATRACSTSRAWTRGSSSRASAWSTAATSRPTGATTRTGYVPPTRNPDLANL
jgi:G3E family GTPase